MQWGCDRGESPLEADTLSFVWRRRYQEAEA
jgi:hypothetical protein